MGRQAWSPLRGDFAVVRLGEGRFIATGPMYGGNRMDLGPDGAAALCASPGVEVAVSSRRMQAADRAILHHLGVDPASRRILALKSSVHFRADFEALADDGADRRGAGRQHCRPVAAAVPTPAADAAARARRFIAQYG